MPAKSSLLLLLLSAAACNEVASLPDARVELPVSTGRYSVTWTCMAACLTDIRYAYTNTLELELESMTMLLFTPRFPESYAPGTLAPLPDGCWEIRGLAEQVLAAWVCPGYGQLDGYIEYQGYPGPPDWLRVWTFAATPSPPGLCPRHTIQYTCPARRWMDQAMVHRQAGYGWDKATRSKGFMAAKARHHHFVPQHYLRLFSDGQSRDSKIFVTDLERKKRYQTCPRNIGGTRDFNRVGSAVDDLEKVFADFDSKVAPILKQMARTRSLPEKADHRNLLLNFVALLLVRVPAVRDHFQALHEQTAREAGRLLVSNPDVYRSVMAGVRERHPPEAPLSPQEEEKRYEEDKRFFEGGDYKITFSHGYFLKYEMDMMDTALHALSRMRWHLLHSDTEFFVCSDRPVSLVSSDRRSRFVGLATPDAEIVMPIANNAALWGAYRGGIASVSAPDEIVRRANGITLANGGICIYSRKRSFRYDDGEGTKTSDSLF